MNKPIAIPYNHKLQYGLGDVLREWLRPNQWTSILKPLSEHKEVHILLCSHNNNTKQLFDYSRFIKVHRIDWPKKTPNYRLFAKKIGCEFITEENRDKLINKYPHVLNDIDLSPAEKKKFDDICKKPVITIHPFAGGPSRMVLSPHKYIPIINNLATNFDVNIVVIGGSYTRGKRLHHIDAIDRKEEFNYERIKLFNLVNKTTTRLAAKLVISSQCFIGTWSAYLCAAWERKIPSIVLGNTGGIRSITGPSFKQRWHKKCRALDVTKTPQKDIVSNIINIYQDLTT